MRSLLCDLSRCQNLLQLMLVHSSTAMKYVACIHRFIGFVQYHECCSHVVCLLTSQLGCDGQGGVPKVQAAMELYNILSESNTDLRQPVGLEEQLLKDDALDSEVGQSMLQLLQVLLAESPAGAPVTSAD